MNHSTSISHLNSTLVSQDFPSSIAEPCPHLAAAIPRPAVVITLLKCKIPAPLSFESPVAKPPDNIDIANFVSMHCASVHCWSLLLRCSMPFPSSSIHHPRHCTPGSSLLMIRTETASPTLSPFLPSYDLNSLFQHWAGRKEWRGSRRVRMLFNKTIKVRYYCPLWP